MNHVMWKGWILLLLCSCAGISHSDNDDLIIRVRRQLIFGRTHSSDFPCMDFCEYDGLCSYRGRCETNQTDCKPYCFCDEGYEGMWCNEVIATETPPQLPSSLDDGIIPNITAILLSTTTHTPTSTEHSQTTDASLYTKSTYPRAPVFNDLLSLFAFPIPSTSAPRVLKLPKATPAGTTLADRSTATTSSSKPTSPPRPPIEHTTRPTTVLRTVPPTTTVTSTYTSPVNPHSDDDHHSDHHDSHSGEDGECESSCVPPNECELVKGVVECVVHNHSDCFDAFPCIHGQCNKENLKNGTGSLYCNCEPNWIGTFCETRCDLSCNEHGYCAQVHHNLSIVCVCDREYTGAFCEQLKPLPVAEKEEDWHWYIAGSCSAIAFILVAVLLLLPYMLWKRRFVFIMKIVYYFQHYEEDDGKEYDAFVSYKSSKEDEQFVLHKLYPVLEKSLNFKLCLHFRDFMVGETIANNIVSAIENSRRTIMVLTPNYVESEWCRMEYQKAQHEMLKLKHKIIPLILEDISSCEIRDANLKTILNSVTYIKWPGEDNPKKLERFWKQLELVLPKKKFVPPTPLLSSTSITSTATEMTEISSSEYIANMISDSNSVCSLDNKRLSNVSLQSDVHSPQSAPAQNVSQRDTSVDMGVTHAHVPNKDTVIEVHLQTSCDTISSHNNYTRCDQAPIDANFQSLSQTRDKNSELGSCWVQTEVITDMNQPVKTRTNNIQSRSSELSSMGIRNVVTNLINDKTDICLQRNETKNKCDNTQERTIVNIMEFV